MSFPRYATYRESGIDWLRAVPAHWEVRRGDSVLEYTKEQARVESFAQRDVFHYSIPAIQETGSGLVEAGADIDSDKLLLQGGELLVSKLNPRKGVVLIAEAHDVPTICSTEFVPMRPVDCDARFAFWLYKSSAIRELISSTVQSVTRSHQRANPSDIVKQWLPLPPLGEQRAISAFLDRETEKIDILVSEQERLIELLKEKRQAIITQVVTKGLKPQSPMTPSGVDWLGEVPANWEIRSISSVTTKITNGYVGPTRDILVDDGVRYLQSLHIKDNRIQFDVPYFVTEEWSVQHAKSILEVGDVLVVQTGDIGQTAVVTKEFAGCNCHALIVISPVRSILEGEWLSWCLNSDYGYHTLLSIQTGALHPHLNCGNVKGMMVPVPPIDEQRRIVAYIDGQVAAFEGLIAEVTRAIDLLQERRTALISAAVTGKIDVRALAGPEAAAT